MAGVDALAPLAQMLVTLPDESVEGLLYAFDSVVQASEQGSGGSVRTSAAQMLRESAANCANLTRRERLLRAADQIAAGEACAATPQQFTEPAFDLPLPGPGAIEEDDDEGDPHLEEAPPRLPHMPVRHFFPGLVVRVAQDFRDSYGRAVCAQSLLKVFSWEREEDGYTVSFMERTVPLRTTVDGHAAILENAGNAWFQPVPTAGCLEDLAEAIDLRLEEAETEDDEDDEGERLDRIGDLRSEVTDCQDWLHREGERGPAPACDGGKLAAQIFGRDHFVTAWVRLLFAAIPVCRDY